MSTQTFRFYSKKTATAIYPAPFTEYTEAEMLKMQDRQPIYYPNDKLWPKGKIAPKNVKASLHEFVRSSQIGKVFETEEGSYYSYLNLIR